MTPRQRTNALLLVQLIAAGLAGAVGMWGILAILLTI